MVGSAKQHDQFQREMDGVRDRVGKNISALRTMSEAVEYEFGADREQHVHTSAVILRSSLTAAALIWNQVAVLHGRQESDFLAEPGLAEMRRRLAGRLNVLAKAVERKISLPAEHSESLVSRHLLENEHYGEYVRNTIAL
jgi:multidrug resistance protein MdtO